MIPDSCPCRKAFFFQLRSSEKNTSFARHGTVPLFQSRRPTFVIANCTFPLQSTLCFPFLRCVSFIFIHKPAIHVVSVISAEVNADISAQVAASVRLRPKHHTEHLELPHVKSGAPILCLHYYKGFEIIQMWKGGVSFFVICCT